MSIKVGDKIPSVTLTQMTADGPKPITTDEVFAGKKVVLFAVPGAFTPLCSGQHLPGYLKLADQFKAKGVDRIVCVSVNDAFVMGAWAKDQQVGDKILMLADGNGDFARAMGLELDGTGFGMGKRSQRYALIAENGIIKHLGVEEGRNFEASKAETILALL
ncbi:peroxiredoxin [Immundisolibacter sp.]|uniref:peroxiredoxin n=1 Tax=Immundisolibacter sp. TaxID=1934948 RepID=UPI0026020245|nr:peroxiredoxin [Immundisolibacter sp.]MDD3651098.1 peroxiredoxin [Immundisolibacter sp.]